MAKQTRKDKLRRPSRRITQVLANNVRAFRKSKGLSQEDLAEVCDLHRTYVGSVERGERNVTLSTLEVIADALGISVPKLLTQGSIENDDEE
jgi:transcriptional regulator with XRE-family HTH domain